MSQSSIAQLQELLPGLPAHIAQQLLTLTKGDVADAARILTESSHSADDESDSHSDANDDAVDESLRDKTLIRVCGNQSSSCGYCHDSKPNLSGARSCFGCESKRLTVQDYQSLIDRNWRRAGTFVYRPDNVKACCPQYAIRFDVNEFRETKSQKRVARRMQRFLDGHDQILHKRNEHEKHNESSDEDDEKQQHDSQPLSKPSTIASTDTNINRLRSMIQSALKRLESSKQLSDTIDIDALDAQLRVYRQHDKTTADAKRIKYASNAAILLQSQIDRHSRLSEPSQTESTEVQQPKQKKAKSQPMHAAQSIALLIQSELKNQDIECTAENGYVNLFVDAASDTIDSKPLQSKSNSKAPSVKQSNVNLKPHSLTVTVESASFTQEAYDLYRAYQIRVHGDKPDKITAHSYRSFLCNSPLTSTEAAFGARHMHYRLDGTLIAVGVVDLLPQCLSSVYLFYDSETYANLDLGTYTVLREIELVREMTRSHANIKFVYLGFWIADCVKMKYKAKFGPSQLLCPLRHTWHHITPRMQEAFKQEPFVVISDVANADQTAKATETHAIQPASSATESTFQSASAVPVYKLDKSVIERETASARTAAKQLLPRVQCRLNGQVIPINRLTASSRTQLEPIMSQYIALVGEELALRCIVDFSR